MFIFQCSVVHLILEFCFYKRCYSCYFQGYYRAAVHTAVVGTRSQDSSSVVGSQDSSSVGGSQDSSSSNEENSENGD